MNCYPAGIYLIKVINGNTIAMSEVCSRLTNQDTKTTLWISSNFEHISGIALVSLLLTLNE